MKTWSRIINQTGSNLAPPATLKRLEPLLSSNSKDFKIFILFNGLKLPQNNKLI